MTSWQAMGRKSAIGQFVRAKAERMVLIRFDGEPTLTKGKNFQQQPVDELHFPISFWDERSVGMKYKDREAYIICTTTKPEVKIFPVSSPPLMRELLDEDEQESIINRVFILSHTGTAKDTSYKFKEVKIPTQMPIVSSNEVQDVEDEEEEEDNNNVIKSGQHTKEELVRETKKRTRKVKSSIITTDGNNATITIRKEDIDEGKPSNDEDVVKAEFMNGVKKRAAKLKKIEMERHARDDEEGDDDEDVYDE